MAYLSGSANSLADLLTAIRNACTANGYTLTGNVLSKGTLYVYLQVSGSELRIQGGTGISGSALTGTGPQYARIASNTTINAMTFPVTYHIHINTSPDEVYVLINYNAIYWNFIAFGKSDHPGLAAGGGTGNWYGATHGQTTVLRGAITIGADAGGGGFQSSGPTGCITAGGLFNGTGGWTTNNYSTNCHIHSGLNPSGGWNDVTGGSGGENTPYYVQGIRFQQPLIEYLPNAWNQQSVLVPITVMSKAASNKQQVVAELRHSRYMRNDFYNDLDIIEIGADKWRVYPFYRKNIAARNGGANIDHSGTFALAVRYDGP